jgi:hypothetical protein
MHDPDRTIGLILEKTPARFSWSEETPWAWTEEEYEADVETYRTNWGTRARAIDEVRRLHPSMADDRGYVDWWHRYQLLSCAPGACVAQTRKYRQTDIRSILPVHGRADLRCDVGGRANHAAAPVDGGFRLSETVRATRMSV